MTSNTDRVRSEHEPEPEDLAAEYLSGQAAGEEPELEKFLARLADPKERQELRDLVDGAGRAARSLPRVLSIGSRIAGRYRITAELGIGGMGKVYAAHDEKLGREVAVKVLAPLTEGNQERERLLEKEWRILAELNHPGIVAIHDAGNDGQFTYIVMDLVEGAAVSDVVDRAARAVGTGAAARNGELLARSIGKPPAPGRRELIDPHDYARSVARIVLEIARTLEAAHEKQVIHRDLKPANVMLLGGGAPIVLDFGLAGSAASLRHGDGDRLHGSLPYVAPEQVKSERQGMDPRTDVYQVGLILYELLTLRRTFPGSVSGEVLQRIRLGYFEKPRRIERSIPRDLEAICMKALEVDLGRRYESARALREDLEAWLEGRPPVASRDARWRSFVRTLRYTARRHPLFASAAGMLLVGLATWLGLAMKDPGPPTNFFRMVVEQGEYRYMPIHERRKEVQVGDCLGYELRSAGNVWVYALSVYGPADGPRYLSPWLATDERHPERLRKVKSAEDKYGYPIEAAFARIVCTELRPDTAPSDYEGIVLLVSPTESEDLERWMGALDNSRAESGVSLEDARQYYKNVTAPVRGHRKPGEKLTPEEEQAFVDGLIKGGNEETHRLGLPNSREYSIECRVAGR